MEKSQVKAHDDDGVRIEQMTITPSLATEWLEGNTHNRPLRTSVVEKYAREMKAGGWKLSNDLISFSPDGVLLNGQHRLWAVFESGRTIEALVAFGMPEENQLIMDMGEFRGAADRYRLSGMDTITKQHVATARKMVGWEKTRKWTDVEQRRFIKRHWDAIDFAVRNLVRSPKGVRATVTMAVLARAWYTVDHAKLERFCAVMKSGLPEVGESAAALISRYLIENSSQGSSFETEKYRKIERSLKAFVDGEALRKLYVSNNEIYLLPEEKELMNRRLRKN